jgi:hypothetical protein
MTNLPALNTALIIPQGDGPEGGAAPIIRQRQFSTNMLFKRKLEEALINGVLRGLRPSGSETPGA